MEFLSFLLLRRLHSLSGWLLCDNSGLSCHAQLCRRYEAPCRPSALSERLCGGRSLSLLMHCKWRESRFSLHLSDYRPFTDHCYPLLIMTVRQFSWYVVQSVFPLASSCLLFLVQCGFEDYCLICYYDLLYFINFSIFLWIIWHSKFFKTINKR